MDVDLVAQELVGNFVGGAGDAERGNLLIGSSMIGVFDPGCRKEQVWGKVVS